MPAAHRGGRYHARRPEQHDEKHQQPEQLEPELLHRFGATGRSDGRVGPLLRDERAGARDAEGAVGVVADAGSTGGGEGIDDAAGEVEFADVPDVQLEFAEDESAGPQAGTGGSAPEPRA